MASLCRLWLAASRPNTREGKVRGCSGVSRHALGAIALVLKAFRGFGQTNLTDVGTSRPELDFHLKRRAANVWVAGVGGGRSARVLVGMESTPKEGVGASVYTHVRRSNCIG